MRCSAGRRAAASLCWEPLPPWGEPLSRRTWGLRSPGGISGRWSATGASGSALRGRSRAARVRPPFYLPAGCGDRHRLSELRGSASPPRAAGPWGCGAVRLRGRGTRGGDVGDGSGDAAEPRPPLAPRHAGYFHPDVLRHHRPGDPVLHHLHAVGDAAGDAAQSRARCRSFWNSVAPSRSRRTERGAEGMKERGGVLLTPALPPHCVHGMSASGSALRVSF